jgi:lipid II:glycine glycyltransferase (peptidoglycan interpeptide bridge formation enzyme)
MTTPRRRIVRPAPLLTNSHPQIDRQIQKLRERLASGRTTLARWMSRLKRAFHAVEKCQQKISRLERSLARKEE